MPSTIVSLRQGQASEGRFSVKPGHLRRVEVKDAPQICAIYNHYVEKTAATFELEPVAISAMRERIMDVTSTLPWLVYEKEGLIAGYAYAVKWRGRTACRNSIETSIYVLAGETRCGIGGSLYTEIFGILCKLHVHTVIAGISLPNSASIGLHEKLGFTKVAHFREVGYKFGRWIDVGYWQKMLAATLSIS